MSILKFICIPGLLLALLAGCTSERVVVESEDWIEVYHLDNQEPPKSPRHEKWGDPDLKKIRGSLRRITVRHSLWIIFFRSDPKPLLTVRQLDYIAERLLQELPEMPPQRRIGFVFYDQFKSGLVDMEVYPDGENLVYRFRDLARRRKFNDGRGPDVPNLAILAPLHMQEELHTPFPTLIDPALSTTSAEEEIPF